MRIVFPPSSTDPCVVSAGIIDGTALEDLPPGLCAMFVRWIIAMSATTASALEISDGPPETLERRVHKALLIFPEYRELLGEYSDRRVPIANYGHLSDALLATLRLYAWFKKPHWIPNRTSPDGCPACVECGLTQTNRAPHFCRQAACPSHAQWALVHGTGQ